MEFSIKKYTQWKTLNMRATGLGRDPITGCIVADPIWWKEQNDVSMHFVVVFFQAMFAQLLQICCFLLGYAWLHYLPRCTT
jgi:hypothetical protein